MKRFEPGLLDQCRRSVLTYGFNDFAGLGLASHDDHTFICASTSEHVAT